MCQCQLERQTTLACRTFFYLLWMHRPERQNVKLSTLATLLWMHHPERQNVKLSTLAMLLWMHQPKRQNILAHVKLSTLAMLVWLTFLSCSLVPRPPPFLLPGLHWPECSTVSANGGGLGWGIPLYIAMLNLCATNPLTFDPKVHTSKAQSKHF